MSGTKLSKYPAEVFLDFRSVHRFLYRVSDLHELDHGANEEILDRLDDSHVYVLGRRPRLSIVPGSIQIGDTSIRLQVEYKLGGSTHYASVELERSLFPPEEHSFESSSYPHRELVSRNQHGEVVASTLLANFAHLFPSLDQRAKDLEVMYIGKGLRHSTQDRLENPKTLQRILAQVSSNSPDDEVFALVYAFEYSGRREAGVVTASIGT